MSPFFGPYGQRIATDAVLSQEPALVVEGPHVVGMSRFGELTGQWPVESRLAPAASDQPMAMQD